MMGASEPTWHKDIRSVLTSRNVQHSTRVVLAGAAMLVAGILTDLIGSELQLLSVLIFSLAISIAGAVVAVRGVFEFMAEKFASRASKKRSV